MRRLLKFFHTLGAAGVIGAMAALVVMASVAPPPTQLPAYAAVRGAMGAIATWMFLPSIGLVLIAGLLSVAVNRAFHNAGWAWLKLITGVLIFEGSFQGIMGPMKMEAERSAAALAGKGDISGLTGTLGAERNTLIVLLTVAIANVMLGIWRPRLTNLPD